MPDREHGEVEMTYFVVRKYRGITSVVLLTNDDKEAIARFEKEKEVLRDGSVSLLRAEPVVIRSVSGGYNRTRW